MSEADVEGIDGMTEPVQVRKRYFRPLLRVGSTGLAITVTGLTYDPVQSTPAPEGADNTARRRDAVARANGHRP